jgi:hypothetical protein
MAVLAVQDRSDYLHGRPANVGIDAQLSVSEISGRLRLLTS